MKQVGDWPGQNRLVRTSLSFGKGLVTLRKQIDLEGAPHEKAILHVQIEGRPNGAGLHAQVGSDVSSRVVHVLEAVASESDFLAIEASEATVGMRIDAPETPDERFANLLRGIVIMADAVLRRAKEEPLCVQAEGKPTRTPEPFDVVMLDGELMNERGISQDQHATIMDATTGTVAEVRLRRDLAATATAPSAPTASGKARISAHMSARLGIHMPTRIVLICHEELSFNHVKLQQLESIAERKVLLGDEDLASIDRNYAYHQVFCPATGNSMVVPVTSFARGPERELGGGSPHDIRLSRQQRALLGLHTPYVISPWFLSRLNSPEAKPSAKAVLDEWYVNGTLVDDVDYGSSNEIWRTFKAEGFDAVRISPLPDAPKGAPRVHDNKVVTGTQKMLTRLADHYLGQAVCIQRVGRPYEVDEDRRIVRLPVDVMSLLGIEVMDCVVVSYGLRSVSVRAMAMENEDKIKRMNALGEYDTTDVLIGMPAMLRAELCLDGMGMTVEVSRDTRFLFQKTINQQFIPALGLFLTVLSIFPPSDDPLWIPLTIFVVLLPFVAYSVLSDERSKVHH